MPTPEEIPPFHEDLSPNEASNWLKTLVATTGSFSDSGIFRLLSTKFEDGTAARKWFDQLEADVKQAWPAFEREFRTRWISIPLQEAEKDSAWDKFCNHKLTYDMIFVGDRLDFDVCAAMIDVWVDEHLALAEATQRGQDDLRETTFTLLPPFIQAFLGAEYDYDRYSPTVFSDLCQQIADLTPKFLKFVWLYHHKYTKKTLEVDIKGVVEKVDNLVNILSHQLSGGGLSSVPDSGAKANSGGNGSVSWEPCSPLTSVISIDEHSENTESQGVATPTAEQLPLPDVAEATPQPPSGFVAPPHWRKPQNLLKKQDRIAIADRALNFVLRMESMIKGNQAAVMNSAFAIFDHLTARQSRDRDSRALINDGNKPETFWYLIEMMYRYQASKDPLTLNKCKEEWREHLQTPGYDYQELCFMSSDRYWAVTSSSRNTTMLYRRQTGEATYAGGIVETYSYKNDDYRILSSQTVLFMALSSYLAEFTKDPEFLKYAIPSATCIKANMLDSHTTLVSDWVIDAFTATFIEEGGVSCALTGICIEGLSILASVTGDDTWRSLALSMAESAMQSKAWHGRNGVLSIGSDSVSFESDVIKSHKGLLNRGLLVAYQRNPSNIHFRDLVRSYINVQYNALLDLSSDGDSYGVNWDGPYTGPYSHGQLAALDTLIAAIGVNE